MDFRDRRVIVTGGTGALGTATVEALLAAGATCHIPCRNAAEAERSPLRTHERVVLTVTGSLADEAAVASLYEGVAPLWASIHIAGGFAAGPLRDMSAATLRQQIDTNLVSCALCCGATALTRISSLATSSASAAVSAATAALLAV
jgi:NAD(P)-dependent dehydrogenase (short-subunit alcohol dehydrogenase family)